MSKRSDDVAAQQRDGEQDLFKDEGRAGSARNKEKQTREPLLDIGSPHDSANGGEGMKLPGNQVSDSVSGFTQQQYMNPAQFYKKRPMEISNELENRFSLNPFPLNPLTKN